MVRGQKGNTDMLKKDGDKVKLMIVLTKDIIAELDKKSAAMGLNRSAYIRMVLYNDLLKKPESQH